MNVSLLLPLFFFAPHAQSERVGTRTEPIAIEHYYFGLSTSQWQRKLRDWEPRPGTQPMPALLHGSEAAIPVLLDLIWLKDKKVVSLAVDGLVHAVPGAMDAIGHSCIEKGDALAIGNGQSRKILLVLQGDNGNKQMLVLLDRAGKLLDGLTCSISTPATLRTDVLDTPAEDGARLVIQRIPLARSSEEYDEENDLIFVFQSWRMNHNTDLPVDWKKRGICRITLAGDRFLVLTPRLIPVLYEVLVLWAQNICRFLGVVVD
jgi:hypothetical protein